MSAEPVTTVADLTLIEALQAGDETAFEEIFRRYYATVFGVLLRLTGSVEEAEDLAQEVFIRLHDRKLSSGANIDPDTAANLGGWLYRVATNLGFNAVRARRRRTHRLLRWARLERPVNSSSPSAAVEVERQAEAEAVRRALTELPERDRTALVLRHSGVPYAEIAEAIGVKPGSVGTILIRAERALRQRYAEMYPDGPQKKERDVDSGR